MANGQTLDEFVETHCGLCMECPQCRKHVERGEQHEDGCSDRAYIRGCTEPPYVVVRDREHELTICKKHWEESDQKDFIRFVTTPS